MIVFYYRYLSKLARELLIVGLNETLLLLQLWDLEVGCSGAGWKLRLMQ